MDTLEKIKKLRKKKGLTQDGMAKRLFIDRSTYNKIETGITELSVRILVKISKILDVPVSDIIEEHDKSFFESTSNTLSIVLHLTEQDLSEKLFSMVPYNELTPEQMQKLKDYNFQKKEIYEDTLLKGRIYKFGPKDVFRKMFDDFGMGELIKQNLVLDEYWIDAWKEHEKRKERVLEGGKWDGEIEIDTQDYFLVHLATLYMPGNIERSIQFIRHEFPDFEDDWKLLDYIVEKTGALKGDYIAYCLGYDPISEIITYEGLNS